MIRGQPLACPQHPIAALGWYSHDNDAVLAGTWAAATGAVDLALSAYRAVAAGEAARRLRTARPPGHHAAADSYAGYCFLNNAAIAAAARGPNGGLGWRSSTSTTTTATAPSRSSTTAATCASSPSTPTPPHEYPFFSGFADEHGSGPGEGATHNFPLPLGTAWDEYGPALDAATKAVMAFGADALVVSLGVDTAAEDYDTFQLVADDFTRIGAAIGKLAPRPCSCRKAATTST